MASDFGPSEPPEVKLSLAEVQTGASVILLLIIVRDWGL